MRILFDHNAPAPLIPFLHGHVVTLARDPGWYRLVDGDLLTIAEQSGFDLLITCDQRIQTQQNLEGRKISLVVLRSSDWRVVQRYVRRIAAAVNACTPGSYIEVEIPFR